MESHRLTPKYLTEAVAQRAVELVLGLMSAEPLNTLLNRQMCHIVVLSPTMSEGILVDPWETNRPDWQDKPINSVPIFEKSVGDQDEWPHAFDDIARSKARQLWRGHNLDGNTDSMPHLLFVGDTPYWGGVKRYGIVVACSGFQPYFDQMFAGMIADVIKALARYEFENSDDKKKGRAFLE